MTSSQSKSCELQLGQRAFSIASKVWNIDGSQKSHCNGSTPTASPTRQRRSASLSEIPFDTEQLIADVKLDPRAASKDTVLYLAFGSNLSAATFQGRRGIRPLSQLNVHVPSLDLSFDLPGIPYTEPCFANTRYRTVPPTKRAPHNTDYHKNRWHKGLVGVVYEVTKTDYATIIATEGGGSGYQDIVVTCHEIPPGTQTVSPLPTTPPFKAHTLFAPPPPNPPPKKPSFPRGRIARQDPDYAQASARYLALITTGATEHQLPAEYIAYLSQIRPYALTSVPQYVGKAVFMGVWMPIILILFGIGRLFTDKRGRLPKWIVVIMGAIFSALWWSYDFVFKKLFGDGERTQGGQGDEEGWEGLGLLAEDQDEDRDKSYGLEEVEKQ